jgi:hypothetical protein
MPYHLQDGSVQTQTQLDLLGLVEVDHPRKPADVLESAWDAADPAARVEFVARVGTDSLWDVIVSVLDAAAE